MTTESAITVLPFKHLCDARHGVMSVNYVYSCNMIFSYLAIYVQPLIDIITTIFVINIIIIISSSSIFNLF